MAKQRYVNTKFWTDPYVSDLDPSEKLLFLYFMTNHLTNISGIYEVTIRQVAFDTGIDKSMVMKILNRFEKDDKIIYRNGWIAIKNFIKHQTLNPKIKIGIEIELLDKPAELIDFVDTSDVNHESIQPIVQPIQEKSTTHPSSKRISNELKDKLFKKYNTCAMCGSTDNLEINRIDAFKGSTGNEEDNLRVLCASCNGKENVKKRWDKDRLQKDSLPKKIGSLSDSNSNSNSNSNINKAVKKDGTLKSLVKQFTEVYHDKFFEVNKVKYDWKNQDFKNLEYLSKKIKSVDEFKKILDNAISHEFFGGIKLTPAIIYSKITYFKNMEKDQGGKRVSQNTSTQGPGSKGNPGQAQKYPSKTYSEMPKV